MEYALSVSAARSRRKRLAAVPLFPMCCGTGVTQGITQTYFNRPMRMIAVPGTEPLGNSPEARREFLRAEIAKWTKVVRAAEAKAD